MTTWKTESNYFDLELQLDLISKLEASISEQEAQLEMLKDGVKEWLKSQNLDQTRAGQHTVSWKPTLTHRFDSQQFKTDHPGLYEQYKRTMEVRRFLVR